VDFLPSDKSFYTYSGSLTTYPCTEGVTWIVFEQPMFVGPDDVKRIIASSACGAHTITKAQTHESQMYAWADNRPLQSLGTRTLTKYDASAPTSAPTTAKTDPISLAAIIIGCVGLVSAVAALGFVFSNMKKSEASKIHVDNKDTAAPSKAVIASVEKSEP